VEFGARMIRIDDKAIKLQIWDTVRCCGRRHPPARPPAPPRCRFTHTHLPPPHYLRARAPH
jgi:hypothetical protein